MDIMLHVGQDGRIALTCDGVFDSLIEGIELFFQSSQLAIKFADVEQPVMMNCPVSPDTVETIMNQTTCAIGFVLGRKLAGAIYVPFQINYFSENERDHEPEDFTKRRVFQ